MAVADPSFSQDETVAEVNLDGLATLLLNAEALITQVVSEPGTDSLVVEGKKEKVKKEKKDQKKESGRLFDTWEEVFGAENLKKFTEEDKNFIQGYRNAIKKIIEKYPERFGDCGDTKVKGGFDWLRALEPVLGLTVGELNEATNSDSLKTVNTTARIVALAQRWADKDGEYIHHDELVAETEKIRAMGKTDETKLLDLFKPEKDEEKVIEVVVYDSKEKGGTEKQEQNEEEAAINLVFGTLKEMHRQAAIRSVSVKFPLEMMTHKKISLYWKPGGEGNDLKNGKTINREFMEKMEKLRLCIPTGPVTGQTHHSYTEKETIKIFVLKLMDADKFHNKNVSRMMDLIDKGYEKGSARFQEWLHQETE